METRIIESLAEKFVREIYRKHFPKWRYFHNIKHTERVVKYCNIFADYYGLDDASRFELICAAWFHDTGYYKNYREHEKESVNIVRQFLSPFKLKPECLTSIKNMILSTRISATPSTMLEKILCDCDLSHIGSPEYQKWALRLRKEFDAQGSCHTTESKWNEENISFFQTHQFFTGYAKYLWDEEKEKNLSVLKLSGSAFSEQLVSMNFSVK